MAGLNSAEHIVRHIRQPQLTWLLNHLKQYVRGEDGFVPLPFCLNNSQRNYSQSLLFLSYLDVTTISQHPKMFPFYFPENSLVAIRSELNSAATSQMNCVYHTAESFEMVGNSMQILLLLRIRLSRFHSLSPANELGP